MPEREHAPLLPITDQEYANQPIIKRLSETYEFIHWYIREETTHSNPLLVDIGTYDGLAVPSLAEVAQVVSFDINPKQLTLASKRPEIQSLRQQNRADLMAMAAQQIALRDGSADVVTAIEVFTGFEQQTDAHLQEELRIIFGEIHRVLKQGGTLIFTVKSYLAEEARAFYGIDWITKKGITLPECILSDLLAEQGFPTQGQEWYGQFIVEQRVSEGMQFPMYIRNDKMGNHQTVISPDAFVPRHFPYRYEEVCENGIPTRIPMYWIIICQAE